MHRNSLFKREGGMIICAQNAGGELIYIPEFNERVCDNCEYREKEIL